MRQFQNYLNAISVYSYHRYVIQTLILVSFILLTGISTHQAHANFESTDSSAVAACPANHKMYYIGANAPTSTQEFPVVSLPLNWTAGNTSRDFTFTEASGNKIFNISFSSIIEKNNVQGAPPFYGSINGSTSSAINLVHDSISTVNNHILNISTNRSVSKVGYKIQDVDSLTSSVIVGYFFGLPIYRDRTPYAEQVDVSANGGRLTFNSLFHTANNPAPNTSVVTAIEGQNCSTGECDIDASWGYKAANSVLELRHNNTINQTSAPHAVGYSNFYFCLAPPKVLVKKVLAGNRVNDSNTNRDQFELSINRGTTVVNAVTTTGSGSAVTNNNNRNAVSIAENTSYTITEKVINGANGTTLGEIANYNASYTCTNATTGSTTVMPTADMTYNAANKTRSFTLSNAAFGDEITCTITNTPIDNYTFTGYVFNDNGGIVENNSTSLDTNTKYDISSRFTGNTDYFNGVFDSSSEVGIGTTAGLSVSLTDCKGNNISTVAPNSNPQTQLNSPLGQFKFTVSASAIANLTTKEVCLVQVEPDPWTFSVDTTPNIRKISLAAGKFDYKTDGSRNLDFGEVKANYASLVLIKSQHVNDCDINANYDGISFSTAEINDIEPGRCIAYKIDAYNRGHVDLKDVQITDELRQTPVKSVFRLPYPKASSSSVYDNTESLPTGTIVSKIFNLDKPTGTSATKATLYFNTKYGTTNGSNP